MQALWVLFSSFMFALMGASVKYVAEHGVGIPLLVVARGLPSVIFIFVWALLKQKSLTSAYLSVHMRRNLFGITALWCSFYSYTLLPLATSISLSYSNSLFVGLYVIFIGKQIVHDLGRLLAVLLGFLGIVMILRPSLNDAQLLGIIAGLSSGLCAALAMYQVKSLGALGEPVWRTVFYFSLVITGSGVMATFFSSPSLALPLQVDFALVGIGVFGLGGQLALTQAYGRGSPILAAVLQYSTIIFGAIIGIVMWGNLPDAMTWLGMFVVIISGILIIYFDQRKVLKLQWKAFKSSRK